MEERLESMRTLGEMREPSAMPGLLELAGADGAAPLRRAAISALAGYTNEVIGTRLTERLLLMPLDVRPAALAVLGSRAEWTRDLLRAVESGRVPPALVSGEVVARIKQSTDTTEIGRAHV